MVERVDLGAVEVVRVDAGFAAFRVRWTTQAAVWHFR
jgi:hypothetical protein